MKLGKILGIYVITFLIFTLIFLFLFRTSIFISQLVLFYRGILLLFLTTIFVFTLAFLFKRLFKNRIESLIGAILVSASINLSLLVVFPVTFDRSITTYLLNILKESQNNSCRGLTKTEMEEKLIDDYVNKKKAITKRIEEQRIINFVDMNNQCVSLTPRGSNFLKFSEIVKKLYNIK